MTKSKSADEKRVVALTIELLPYYTERLQLIDAYNAAVRCAFDIVFHGAKDPR